MIVVKFIAPILLGYLLGSLPFGLWIGQRESRVDIRDYGSGRTGATNVLRTAGRKAAALSGALDVLKGVLAVVFAGLIVGDAYVVVGGVVVGALLIQVLAALAAMFGHIWSAFLKFQGGRGVSVFAGALLVLCPPAALFGGVVIIGVIALTRYVSLGSIAGAVGTYVILAPLTILSGYPVECLLYTFIGAVVIIFMHRDNIARLVSGTERKLGEKARKRSFSSSTPSKS